MSVGNGNGPVPRPILGFVRHVAGWARSLPEGARVPLYSGAVLAGIALAIIVVVYRAEIGWGLLLVLPISLVLLVLGSLGYAVLRLSQKHRLKTEAATREAEEVQRQAETRRAEILRAIAEGEIQPMSDNGGLFLRNSEALWYRCAATAVDRRGHPHSGELHITSLRILFVSHDYPVEIPLGSVNAANTSTACLSVIGKTTGASQTFHVADPEITAAHIQRTIKAYHRQVDVGFEESAGRHIPQDIKTTVWQRDAGKCVECGATDYLEFDHIIPFAKGGASTVDNVQLLCRRCNLRKGPRI